LHSVIVLQKRDSLKAWTVFLALLTFTFSMMGAFLVRSGVLTSVHAFAVDPQRGIILLGILFVVAGLAFSLFALRAPTLSSGQGFSAISRESALVINNLLIAAALASVVLGTLYPIVIQALFDQTMSVGAPYFIMVFAPIMGVAMLVLPIATFLAWKQSQLMMALKQLTLAAAVALFLAGLGWMLFRGGDGGAQVGLFVGLALGVFVVGGTFVWLNARIGWLPKGDLGVAWSRFWALPPTQHAMWLAHLGLGIFVLGAVVESHARQMQAQPMAIGETIHMGAYSMRFDGLYKAEGPNYDAQGGHFTIRDATGKVVCSARPQRRFYPDSAEVMGKVALCFEPLNDFYVVLAEPHIGQDNVPRWQVRLFKNTWIRLVFLGPLLMALAGFIALFGLKRVKTEAVVA
jgi:cytochrome c-type biogenesis protein CcmF